jgi:urease accessory protein
MLRLTQILGNAAEPNMAERLHELAHRGGVETITLRPEDTPRHRLRVVTDRGTEGAIVLARTDRLEHGAVLLLEPDRAVVVCLHAARWLGVRPRDRAAALQAGFLAGNMHWTVRFQDDELWIRTDGDPAAYRARLAELLDSGRAELLPE